MIFFSSLLKRPTCTHYNVGNIKERNPVPFVDIKCYNYAYILHSIKFTGHTPQYYPRLDVYSFQVQSLIFALNHTHGKVTLDINETK